MKKLTVEGLVKLLKEIEQDVGLSHLELFGDGSGSLENVDGSTIMIWDNLDGLFNYFSEIILSEDVQSQLAEKFN